MTTFGKILIGLMLATAAVLIIKGGNKAPEEVIVEEVQEENAPVESTESGQFNGSIVDLASRGGNYECTFASRTDVADSTGTVYISGIKIRGDFMTTTKVAGNLKIESHMISDGEFVYTWSAGTLTGFKVAVSAESNPTSTESSASFDYNQKLDYDCKAWTVEETKFMVPTDIKFTTI